MFFGKRGRERVVDDLKRLWGYYSDIVNKQHHLRTDLERLYQLERREAELRKHVLRIQGIRDLDRAADDARTILRNELHHVDLIEKNIDRCMSHMKDQKGLIRRIRKDLVG